MVSSVQVIEVLYGQGAYEPEVSRSTAPSIASLYTGLTNSSYFDTLSQYSTTITDAAGNPGTNQLIGRGSFRNQVTIAPSPANDGATIDDSNIAAELVAQVNAGNLPPENGNVLYAVYFPVGKTITVGPGQASGTQFCAYHGTTAGPQDLYYSVLPDFSTGAMARNCGFGNEYQNVSAVSSHELAEVVTDPEVGLAQSNAPPLAWYYSNPSDPNQSQVGEIGDICNGQDTTAVGGDGLTYTVQKLWSNAQNACTAAPPGAVNGFALSAAPGSVSVAPGATAAATVTTTVSSGSAGAVALSATGAPSGVTAVLSPTSVTAGASSTLTLATQSTALPGTYPITITGVEGSVTRTATVSLTIASSASVGSGLVAVNDTSAWVMSSTGSSFNGPSLWSSSTFFGNVATLSGDVAGTGHPGLVAVNGNSVWVMLSTGSGFSAPQLWATTSVTGTRATLLGDVNGDGKSDLVAVNDGNVSVMLSTGSGFLPPTSWSSGPFYGSVSTVIGDVTGHHRADLVAVNPTSTWVMSSTGSGFSAPKLWSTSTFYGSRATVAGDVSGDGKADLVAINGASVWVMTSTGSGFANPAPWSSVPFYGSVTTLLGDVNGDGAMDLIAVNGSSCWVMTAAGTALSSPRPWSSSAFVGTRATLVNA